MAVARLHEDDALDGALCCDVCLQVCFAIAFPIYILLHLVHARSVARAPSPQLYQHGMASLEQI